MLSQLQPPSKPWVAIFDLDGTLTWRDTLLPYLLGYASRHPRQWLRAWRVLPALGFFVFGGGDRGRLKSRLIRMILGGQPRRAIDAWTAAFVRTLNSRRRFRPAALAEVEAHRRAGDRLVLLSASPDLYVPSIGDLLGFERTVCTEIAWRNDELDGTLKTPNRRGEEKVRCLEWLRVQYPGAPIVAYGNSASDLPHMAIAERALLVNAGTAARRLAVRLGVPTADWS